MKKCLLALLIFAAQWAFAQEGETKILQGKVKEYSNEKNVQDILNQP